MARRVQHEDEGEREGARPEREALLRALIETSPDGLVTIDATGQILSFNPAAARMFGYRAEEVIGRNVSCLMPARMHKLRLRNHLPPGVVAVLEKPFGDRELLQRIPFALGSPDTH